MERQPTTRRKGISVSLTPAKHSSNPQSPCNSHVHLQQSHVVIHEPQPSRKYTRVVSLQRPVVRFHYSNVSKQSQIREGIILDQELRALKRQIEQKRALVSCRQAEQIHSPPKPMMGAVAPFYNIAPMMNVTPPQAKIQLQTDLLLSQPKIEFSKEKLEKQNVFIFQEQSLPIRDPQPNTILVGGSPAKTKFSELQKNKEAESKRNKENKVNWREKKAKLKWAQEKMLEIIRVCEEGL